MAVRIAGVPLIEVESAVVSAVLICLLCTGVQHVGQKAKAKTIERLESAGRRAAEERSFHAAAAAAQPAAQVAVSPGGR